MGPHHGDEGPGAAAGPDPGDEQPTVDEMTKAQLLSYATDHDIEIDETPDEGRDPRRDPRGRIAPVAETTITVTPSLARVLHLRTPTSDQTTAMQRASSTPPPVR